MTTFAPDLAGLLSAVSVELKAVRLQVIHEDELLLEGLVPTVEQKQRLEQAALTAGFRVRNHLRVSAAAFADAPGTRAS